MEYVTDVPYVRNFEADLGPGRLRFAAALNGFPTPPADDFDYCELGSAQGDTTVAMAAANPEARFVGVDLMAEHIALAEESAKDGGLANVRFLERDFEDLLGEDVGTFDFICAHGVLSWVGPQKRKALIDFASSKLKPGGLLYVSYNAMPGWAAVEPLRQLILSRADGVEDSSLERARRGVDFAKKMRDAGAEYFAENPAAREMLDTIDQHGLAYAAHEYLHAHWSPMYFAQVAWEMASRDLYFVGGLPLYLNYRDLAIPSSLAKVFEEVADRVTFESLKDFALNEFFRRDVYIKGKVARSADATPTFFDTTPFGRVDRGPAREVALPHHTLRFDGPIFDALEAAVGEGAAAASSLVARPELASFGIQKVRAALLRLALGGHLEPMRRSTTRATDVLESEQLAVPSPYNRMILGRTLEPGRGPLVLASPAAGTAFSVPALQAIVMRLLTEVPHGEREKWTRNLFAKHPVKLKVGDRAIEDVGEQVRMVEDELARFRETRLAKFIELGILARR